MRRYIFAITLAALVVLSLFLVTAGNPLVSAKTPLWVYHTDGTINSISLSENGSYVVAGVGFNDTAGAVLLFNGGGKLLWEDRMSRIIAQVSISANGSRVEASGYQLVGLGGAYVKDEVYALNSQGDIQWNQTAGYPWPATMATDGARIAIYGAGSVALLTWRDKVVWNYTAEGYPLRNNTIRIGPPTYLVSQNGSRVPIATKGMTLLGSGDNTVAISQALQPIPYNSPALVPNGTLLSQGRLTSGINSTLSLLTGSTVDSVLAETASRNGAFAAASVGLSGQGGRGFPSALYFFSTPGSGSLLQGAEDKLVAYTQSSVFTLFELGTIITMVAFFGALVAMSRRRR